MTQMLDETTLARTPGCNIHVLEVNTVNLIKNFFPKKCDGDWIEAYKSRRKSIKDIQ